MHGVHGRYLTVDLSSGESQYESLSRSVFEAVLGGIGLASWLLLKHCPGGTEPLSPENPLIFATSPFVDTGITTASKLAVAARSPQTGFIGDSLSSSYLTIELKRLGVDALVVTGTCSRWSTLVLEPGQVSIRDAAPLVGLSGVATSDQLRSSLGDAFRMAAIGVAAENGVLYAAISNDGRLAGRTGSGAVMASKRLKAIAIRGDRPTSVAHLTELAAAAARLTTRSLGPETAKYRDLGTVANLTQNGATPTRNFGGGEAHALKLVQTDRHACASCTVGCEHHFALNGRSSRLEYETLFALGPLCGIDDGDTVLEAGARCDELGLDSISTGATIAWAMECAERGVSLPGGDPPRFGDGRALLDAIDAIGHRRGVGDLLAEGSKRASELVGQGSDEWAMHCKGLEMPGYDPRKLETMALGLAVAARGACQNRSGAYQADLSGELSPEADAVARARAAIATEDQAAILDSLTVCKFIRRCFDDLNAEAAELYGLVTGLTVDLAAGGARINTVKKLFNQNHGWTRVDDTLPARVADPARLAELVSAYYQERRWSAEGYASDILVPQ